jgi:hypothetical protein
MIAISPICREKYLYCGCCIPLTCLHGATAIGVYITQKCTLSETMITEYWELSRFRGCFPDETTAFIAFSRHYNTGTTGLASQLGLGLGLGEGNWVNSTRNLRIDRQYIYNNIFYYRAGVQLPKSTKRFNCTCTGEVYNIGCIINNISKIRNMHTLFP